MKSESEHAIRNVLLDQPGIAAVDRLHVKRRWGRTRGVMACVTIAGGADPHEVCRNAVEALTSRLRVADVCLVAATEVEAALQGAER